MAGYRFHVSGDPVRALQTVYASLQAQGFSVAATSDWSGHAERGSQAASVALGALAGSKGRHVILDVACAQDPQGTVGITLTQGTSGWSGGLIGKGQADGAYRDVYQAVGSAYQSAGVLVASEAF